MYIYIYIHTRTYIYIYIYTHMYVCIYIYTHIHMSRGSPTGGGPVGQGHPMACEPSPSQGPPVSLPLLVQYDHYYH